MGRPERALDPRASSLAAFAADLRQLREAAGSPTYARLARATGRSRTALSEAAGGGHLPTWETTHAYVSACGGDVSTWRHRWQQLRDELDGPPSQANAFAQDRFLSPAEPPELPADAVARSSSRNKRVVATTVALLTLAATVVIIWRLPASQYEVQSARVTVQNKHASGSSLLAEDDTAAFLSTRPTTNCRTAGCVTPGTDRLWSGDALTATCWTSGDQYTNADMNSEGIEQNPHAYTSTLWYWVQTTGGEEGFLPEAYVDPAGRGGLDLPRCAEVAFGTTTRATPTR